MDSIEKVLEGWDENILSMVKKVTEEHDELVPMAFLLVKERDNVGTAMMPVGMFFSSQEGKDQLTFFLKEICSQKEVYAIALTSEA